MGSGPEVLVAFHGYDQTGLEFAYFEDVLGERFTIISIDFFWHGNSEWREEEDFTEADMKAIVAGIAQAEHLHNKRFSVCSYSMGARMARALVRSFPDRIDHLILLSPPTFSFNRFLNFTTRNVFGLGLFRYFLRNHHVLRSWVERLHRMKILNRSVYVFTSKFIVHPKRLEKVYKTWYAQRNLLTDFSSFAKLLDHHQVRVILIVGKNDSITPPKKMIAYIRRLKHGQVHLIHKKHELATPETKAVFRDLFRKQ